MTRRRESTLRSWLIALLLVPAPALVAAQATTRPAGAAGTTRPAGAAAAPDVPPEVREVLEQVKSAYTKLQAARFDGKMTSDMLLGGKPTSTSVTFSSSFQAPNKFRHQFGDELTLGSTGQKVFAHNRADNSYLLADAPDAKTPVNDLPSPIPQVLSSQNPSLLLALERAPLESLPTLGQNLKKVADHTIEGKPFTRLLATLPGDLNMTVLIDPKTHLLRRIALRPANPPATQPADRKVGGVAAPAPVEMVQLMLDYTTIDTSPQFAPEHFAWNPPEGATDVATARPRLEQTAAESLVGKAAPDFKLDTLKGGSMSLADAKGQIVLLDFWASWCPPCVESLPHLGRLYGQEQDGVKVLAVNLMEDRNAVQAFATAQRIDVPILLDKTGAVAKKYHVSGIPQTVLIGPDGVVKEVFVGLGPDMYDRLGGAIKALKQGEEGEATVAAAATTAPTTAPAKGR